MRKLLFASMLFAMFLLLSVPAQAQTTDSSVYRATWAAPSGSGVDINAGIPAVTSQQVVAKAYRIFNDVYGVVSAISPGLTLIVVVLAAVAGIFFEKARRAAFWAGLGLMVVMWGPKLLGWFMHVLHS